MFFRIFLLIIYFLLNFNRSCAYPQVVQIIDNCPASMAKTNSSKFIHAVKQNYLSITRDSHENESNEDQSIDLKSIEITLTIPSVFVNGTIINQSLFIIDKNQHDLNLTHARLCMNGSNFYIKYLTNQQLPHTICLYLHLIDSQLYICQILTSNSGSNNHDDDKVSTPSGLFIISQSVIIGLFMILICTVHTWRQKHIIHRVRRHLLQTNDSNLSPMQEEILSATDLTSISIDRQFRKTNSITLDELTNKLTY